MIKFYGRATAFNVIKVGWFLTELGLEFEHIQVGGRFGGLDTAEYGKLNPTRKIPTVVDNGQAIWESHTILRYLAEVYGSDQFYPADPFERSLQNRWMDWSLSVFQPAFIGLFWGYYRTPPSKRDMDFVNARLEQCEFHLNALDGQLAKTRFLAGDNFSIGDIPAGAVLYRLTEIGISVELPASVDRWYAELKQRAGYQEWVMGDFSELEAREDF